MAFPPLALFCMVQQKECFELNAGQQIMELVRQYDLIDRTFAYFWSFYDSYLTEEPDEARGYGLIDRDSVHVSLHVIECRLKHFDENRKHRFMTICVTLGFRHRDQNQKWNGTYECMFFMNGDTADECRDGEVCDDFFWIE